MPRLFLAIISVTAVSLAAPHVAHGELAASWAVPNNSTVVVPSVGSTLTEVGGHVATAFDALLVYDTSSSMSFGTSKIAPNGGSQRGDWAFGGTNALIDTLDDRVGLGLVQFDTNASLVVPLGVLGAPDAMPSHRATLKGAVQALDRFGNTDISFAISFAAQYLDSLPENSRLQHLILVTDGGDDANQVISAVSNAMAIGIDSIHTVGLPGANVTLLQNVAQLGNGVFVDGTDVSTLVAQFRSILDEGETLAQLDIILPDGNTLEDIPVSSSGAFMIEGAIHQGDNLFRARAISNLGNVVFTDLNIVGVAAPEPAAAMLIITGAGLLLGFRRRQRQNVR